MIVLLSRVLRVFREPNFDQRSAYERAQKFPLDNLTRTA